MTAWTRSRGRHSTLAGASAAFSTGGARNKRPRPNALNGPIQFPTPQSGLQTRMNADLPTTEVTINSSIHLVGICIEAFGVLIIVAGIIWSTYRYIRWGKDGWNYDRY